MKKMCAFAIYLIENRCILHRQTLPAYAAFDRAESQTAIALAPKRKILPHHDVRGTITEHLPYSIVV